MNDNKAVTIGTVIGGYRIYGICGEYCIAENIAPRTADSFVVWTIDNDKNGVHTGRYYGDKMDAEWEFASSCFPWFQDNVNINITEDECTETNVETAE